MTARRRTLERAAAQERVIAALLATGDPHVADRLQRCMDAMTSRRNGSGYPWACRSAGCAWCGRTRARRWWTGLRRWIASGGAPVSLAVLPLPHRPGTLRAAVVRLRRGLRDVRDRTARRRASWRGVALAGIATGDDVVFMLVSHPGIARSEVADILRKRWSGAVVQDVGAAEPSWAMLTVDAAEIARIRRSVEPLRIVVLPQRRDDPLLVGRTAMVEPPVWLEPMPVVL